jgi:CheY-like chemotaxis protein
MRYKHKPIHIMLVEDNPADADLAREAFRTNDIPYRLSVADTAGEALDFAFRRGVHRSAQRPDIIVLDLRLGAESGHDVLSRLKSDPHTHCIPVIVMSASEAEPDVHQAYGSFANCYITKPFHVDEFMRVIREVERFWAHVAVLPDP